MAGLQIFRNASWHPLQTLQVYRNGAWRRLKTLKVYSGGAWRLIGNFMPPLSVSAYPTGVGGVGYTNTSVIVGSNPTTATPAGGLAPYTYNWAKVSGDAITASQPNSATTDFGGTVAVNTTASAIFRVTCTDSSGRTATADVSVNLFAEPIG